MDYFDHLLLQRSLRTEALKLSALHRCRLEARGSKPLVMYSPLQTYRRRLHTSLETGCIERLCSNQALLISSQIVTSLWEKSVESSWDVKVYKQIITSYENSVYKNQWYIGYRTEKDEDSQENKFKCDEFFSIIIEKFWIGYCGLCAVFKKT
jgi:hypothetical protein